MISIEYDVSVFKENDTYIAYCQQLDISSCGRDVEQAKKMLKTAINLFIEESEKIGTINDILEEAGYTKDLNNRWIPPRLVATEIVSVP